MSWCSLNSMHDTSLLHLTVIIACQSASKQSYCHDNVDNSTKLNLAWLKYTFCRTVPVCMGAPSLSAGGVGPG